MTIFLSREDKKTKEKRLRQTPAVLFWNLLFDVSNGFLKRCEPSLAVRRGGHLRPHLSERHTQKVRGDSSRLEEELLLSDELHRPVVPTLHRFQR
jgi:hypothetical protein